MRHHRSGSIVNIGDIKVLATTAREFVDRFDSSLSAGTAMKVAFLNANLANIARSDSGLTKQLDDFLVLNDGIGINIASLILHRALFPENMNGTDFIPTLLTNTKHSLRIFLLGAREHTVAKAASVIASRWTRHQVVGFHQGYFDEQECGNVAAMIADARPDLLLVALGNPKQEDWTANYVPKVCNHAFAVGALFDFMSGEIPRASHFVRSLHLEWLFRMWNEPGRLSRRYLIGVPSYLLHILLCWLNQKKTRSSIRGTRTPSVSAERTKLRF